MTAEVILRKTETRLSALRAATEGRVKYVSPRIAPGEYKVELAGMPGEWTTSHGFKQAVDELVKFHILTHARPCRPLAAGIISVTDLGRALLAEWNN